VFIYYNINEFNQEYADPWVVVARMLGVNVYC